MPKTKTRKKYTPEFKAQAVEMVGDGRPVPSVAEDLEIGAGLRYRSLRGENAKLRMENYILKKAAVILGTRPRCGHESLVRRSARAGGALITCRDGRVTPHGEAGPRA